MKYRLYKHCGTALCLSLALLATSCSMSDDLECPPEKGGTAGTGKAYIQLSFGLSGAQGTRANPDAGETGDGPEAGQDYENRVNSAVAFLFDGDADVNSPDETPVIAAVYFGNVTSGDGKWITETQQADVDNGTYNVIVVANPGADFWWSTAGNLSEVRDKIYTTAWTKSDDGTYSDFLMALADEPSERLVVENNPKEDPATISVNVERVAARVDYKADGEFKLTGTDYADASVKILGATIINDFSAGSYLLKRVSGDPMKKTGGDVTYLGIEETGADRLPTNYVIDPWTADKNSTNAELNNTPFTTVDGHKVNAAGLYVDGSYLYSGSEDPEWWSTRMTAGTPITDPGDDGQVWQRVGYTLENTTAQDQTAKTYNTGLAFQAQFNPGSALADYKPGHTFFRYSDRLYTSLTAMMGQLNEQADFAAYFNAAVDGLKNKTWADVTAFCEALPYDPVGLAGYFTGLQGDAQGTDAVGTALDNVTWTAFLATLGVGESDITDPQINQGGVTDTRARLYASSNGMLRTYYKGLCYYVWWLRHSNDNSDMTNGLMEYAVVRNNIYKVKVETVASIGGDVPDDTEIKAHVYVKDWVLLEKETLPM